MSIDRRALLRAAIAAAASGAGAAGCGTARRPPGSPVGASGAPGAPTPPSSGPLPAGLPSEVVHGPRERAAAALTFHGSGDARLALRLLQAAEQAGARLTVLAVGSWLDEQPAMARRILDGGHELGNHTQNHRDIAHMDAADAYAEIAQCAERLRRLTGSIGRWFRPSQTRSATTVIREQARLAGYPTCLSYDVDSLDYTDPGPEIIVRTVLGSLRPGSIVSLHLGHAGTVTALPALLDDMAARRLRAVTVTELLT